MHFFHPIAHQLLFFILFSVRKLKTEVIMDYYLLNFLSRKFKLNERQPIFQLFFLLIQRESNSLMHRQLCVIGARIILTVSRICVGNLIEYFKN